MLADTDNICMSLLMCAQLVFPFSLFFVVEHRDAYDWAISPTIGSCLALFIDETSVLGWACRAAEVLMFDTDAFWYHLPQ